jgi:hypothetical protein
MRTSMVYVLLNFRKHLRAPACIDPRSSGMHFSGWERAPGTPDAAWAPALATATALPSTWMARMGWRRAGGPLRVEEHPAASPRPTRLDWADVASGRARRRAPPGAEPTRRRGMDRQAEREGESAGPCRWARGPADERGPLAMSAGACR